MNKQKKLTPLYIEDLGQVTGGKWATTLALGEEGPINPTTLGPNEEGPPATTLAIGEETPTPTTLAIGEETYW